WRNQPHVSHRACRPCIALVDRIAMLVELQAAIKMRARVDRPFPPVRDGTAVQEYAPFVIDGLQLDPDVERVNSPAREKVADLPRADDDVDAERFATSHGYRNLVERREDFSRGRGGCRSSG